MTKNMLMPVFITALFFVGCESSDVRPVEKVHSDDIVSSVELQRKNQEKEEGVYYFGFDPRNSPQKDVARYIPLMNYLEKRTGVKFKLHFTPKNSSTVEELGRNNTQFALMGAMGFLKAQMLYSTEVLVRGINRDGESKYRSFFVTRPDSTITGVRGHTLAFGDVDSTQGHLIPKIELKKKGVSIDSLKAFAYTGSHQKCVESVISGRYEICAMQDQLAQRLFKKGLIRVIHRSSWYPSSGIVANSSVPQEVLEKVQKALVDFDPQGRDKEGLYHWEDTEMPLGFTAVNPQDYAELREWAIKLGLLPQKD